MSTEECILNLGLLGFVLYSQYGSHPLTRRRFLLPLLIVGVAAWLFIPGAPTIGGDLNLELAGVAAGVVFGLLAGWLVNVDRDIATGLIVARAGLAYAALWVAVIGGRMLYAWAATNVWSQQVTQFSIDHQITGAPAWKAAFVLMALTMVIVRVAVTAARAGRIAGSLRPVLAK